MSWKPRRSRRGPEVDPFNAPDPTMPGVESEDPEPAESAPAEAARDLDDGVERIAQRNERKEPGHHQHRPKRSRRRPDRPTPSGHADRSKRKHGKWGCLIAIIILIVLDGGMGLFFTACGAVTTGFNDLVSSDSTSWEDENDSDEGRDFDREAHIEAEAEAQAKQTVSDALDAMIAGDDAAVARVAAYLDESMSSKTGYTASELGIDASAFARRALAQVTYELDTAFAYADPIGAAGEGGYQLEAPVFFNITAPTVSGLGYELSTALASQFNYYTNDGPVPAGAAEAVQERLAELEASWEPTELYSSLDLTGTADAEGTITELTIEATDLDDLYYFLFGSL